MDERRFDGERLAELMQKRGVGDTEMGRLTGLSRTMIYYLRLGKRKTASAENITRIANALDTTVDYLIGEKRETDEVVVRLPEPVRQLADIAKRLSGIRQEELLRIAATLEALEAEQRTRPLPAETMDMLLALAEKIHEEFGGDDPLDSLEALLRMNFADSNYALLATELRHGASKPY